MNAGVSSTPKIHLIRMEPDAKDTCPECEAKLSPVSNAIAESLIPAYCDWSPPGEDTPKLIPLDQTDIDPQLLQPHPENEHIYGENEDISVLVELIQESRWIKPIVVSQHGRIISGHRCWKAAVELRWLEVPIFVKEFSNEMDELEALLLENATRDKNPEQKVREGLVWESIEGEKARVCSLANLKQNQNQPTEVENFPPREKGKTRDALANRVGLGSGRNYDKAATVVAEIDKLLSSNLEQNQEFARILRHTLNKKSVHAAYQLIHPAQKGKSFQTKTERDNEGNGADGQDNDGQDNEGNGADGQDNDGQDNEGNGEVLDLLPDQLMFHLRSDEWLKQTITLSQGELNRRVKKGVGSRE
jgi:ParB-like nuclease domain